ncbi:MAG: hypothetical protein KJ077_41205 [Anaerolineae bacterium]|nr:hypothetical protein [Anaerolineae bacterium]
MATYPLVQPAVSTWEDTFRKVVLVLARLALAYLFFASLFWKMPPTFGCPPDYAFATANAEGRIVRSQGLCDWIGVEAVWSQRPRQFFVTNLDNQGEPEIALDVSWLAQMNGAFLENFVKPNIRWFGYVVWGMEAFIFVTLFFGLFSRLGGLVALAQTAQLQIGLAGISSPFEWEWSYHLMVLVSLLIVAFAPGRYLGLDAWLRPRLQAAAGGGNRLAGLLLWLT